MKRIVMTILILSAVVGIASREALAGGRHTRVDRKAMSQASRQPWHGEYAHTAHGYPVPLVISPLADTSVEYGWGVTHTEVRPIYHQFLRPYGGDVEGDGVNFHGTPAWPSHTRQFGVQYIRGPW